MPSLHELEHADNCMCWINSPDPTKQETDLRTKTAYRMSRLCGTLFENATDFNHHLVPFKNLNKTF